jgi:hypothetical protein
MRRDLNYGNQPSIIMRAGNTLLVKPEPILGNEIKKSESGSAVKSEGEDVTIITEDQFLDQKGSESKPSTSSHVVLSFRSDSSKSTIMQMKNNLLCADKQRLEAIKGFG